MAVALRGDCALLRSTLGDDEFRNATSIYNALPDISEQGDVDRERLILLGNLFVLHSMEGQFGVHLLHSHHPIPDDTILLGTSYKVPPVRRWAKPTRIEDLRGTNLHGHTYAVRDGSLRPYEFQSGSAPELSGPNVQAFLEEFCKLVEDKGLQNQIALEILDSEAADRTPMLEFIVDQENHVLVEAKAAQQSDSLRPTGWVFVAERSGVTLKGNTAYAGNSGEHKTFTDGKPLTIEKLGKLVPA